MVSLSFDVLKYMAYLAEFLPNPPLTRDQLCLLHYDNIVSPGAMTFTHLNLAPLAVEMVVPGYLARFRRRVAAPLRMA